jgi:hypothetical protein
MSDFKGQSESTKFCFKLGKTAIEMYEMLKFAFGEETMSRTLALDWCSNFKSPVTSLNNAEYSGHPSMSSMDKNVA